MCVAVDCIADEDCPGAETCVANDRAEPFMCMADVDCIDPRVCGRQVCLDPCQGDEDCPGQQVCFPDGHCADPAPPCEGDGDCDGLQRVDAGACEDDSDCVGDRICEGGMCQAGCIQSADFDDGERCVLGRCQAGVACEQDGDCIAPRLRIDRACVETPFCVGDEDSIGARICEAGAESTALSAASARRSCTSR